MPYINFDKRIEIAHESDGAIQALQYRLQQVARDKRKGSVNYVISRIVLGAMEGHTDYHTISDAISVLRDAAAEIERRLMGPREDVAIAKNGDLPEYEDLL